MSNHRSSVFALAAISSLAVTALTTTSASAMHAGFGGGGLGGGGSGQAASIVRTSGGLGGGGGGQAANIGRTSSSGLGQSSLTHKGSTRWALITIPQGKVGTPNILLRTPLVAGRTPNVKVGTPLVPLGPPNVQIGTPVVPLGTPVVPLGPPNVQIGPPTIPVIPPGQPPCEGFCGPILPPPVVAGPDPHGHPGLEWHHPHWGIAVDPVTVVVDPVTVDAVAATAPCNCLTKQYLDDGSVLFKDICTKEAAMATPDELRAQAQGAALQAQ